MLHVRYGSYIFEPHEASLSIDIFSQNSRLGFALTRKVQINVVGEFCDSGTETIDAKVQGLFNALEQNGGDVGLYYTATGLPTSHVLYSQSLRNLTGNQVRNVRLPEASRGEFITGRQFSFTVEAELDYSENPITDWVDTIVYHGNAGPQWEWFKNPQWGHYPQLVSTNSLQLLEHVGYAVGANFRPLPVTPFFSPPFEDNLRRKVTFTTGKRYPRAYRELRTDWHYIYRLPVANDTIRPTLP